jgi:hypothetical protein
MREMTLVEAGFHPDCEKFGPQIPLVCAGKIKVPATQIPCQVKSLIQQALRSICVGIDDKGGTMQGNRVSHWAFVSLYLIVCAPMPQAVQYSSEGGGKAESP